MTFIQLINNGVNKFGIGFRCTEKKKDLVMWICSRKVAIQLVTFYEPCYISQSTLMHSAANNVVLLVCFAVESIQSRSCEHSTKWKTKCVDSHQSIETLQLRVMQMNYEFLSLVLRKTTRTAIIVLYFHQQCLRINHGIFHISVMSCHGNIEQRFVEAAVC